MATPKLAAGKAEPLPTLAAKLPKSLGSCVDLYKAWNAKRLIEKKKVDAIELIERTIKNHIIENLPKGDTGVVGAHYKAVAYNEEVFQVADWETFYKWIKANDAFDVLNRAINQAAIADRVDTLNAKLDAANAKVVDPKARKPRKLLPGLKTFTVVKLSVTVK